MSSLSGGGVGGGCGGGHFLEKTAKNPVRPQVHLNMGVHPPVLDTLGLKPPSTKSTSTSCRGTRKVGGHWFATSVRNWYNSLCTGTPLTWVNPHMVTQFQTVVPMSDQFYPGVPYSMEMSGVGNSNPPPFWYQATPGSQFDCQDPLQSLNAYPFSNMLHPVHHSQTVPVLKNGFNKSSQPLNPEAKEWIPSSFRDGKYNKSSSPNCSFLSHDKLVVNPFVFADVTVGFEEITDNEINDVRKNCNIEALVPKKAQDHKYREMSNKRTLNCNTSNESEVVGNVAEQFNDGSTMVLLVDTLNDQLEENCNVSSFDGRHKGNTVQSYASIAGRSPEPPPLIKSKKEIGIEKECVTPIESVQQRIPKIFMKDKKYPKEKAAPSMESKRRDPLPFRTASKTQKKSRRKFLKDLRDLSPAKSDSSFSGNESSFESTDPEIMARLCVSGLPLCMSSPKEKSVGSCFPSKNVKSQHSTSESSTSSSCVRTMSESSTGSVESVDVEFVDVVDRGGNEPENISVLTEKCPSNNSPCGKQRNSALAYILGLDESESEDSDEDTDDGDWDDVGECESLVLDDSWETFGLTIPLITKSSPCARVSVEVNTSENICDNDYNFMLDDINKRWEDEVNKDLKTASPGRVSFGDVSVHSMVTWAYAYKNARRGPWEQYARDRVRFSNRISEFEPLLSPVLQADHRKKMYCKIYGH